MRKKSKWLALWIGIVVLMTGCAELPEVGTADVTPSEWQLMLDSSKDTTINVYHDYTDPKAKKWMDMVLRPYIKETLGMEVVINTLNLNELIPKLKDEKLNEVAIGDADLLILTKKGFGQLKDSGLLYGPFSNKIPNVAMNQVPENYENTWLDGKTIDNMAVQIGKKQLALFYDENITETPPADLNELKNYMIANPGKFTFPSLDTMEGQAFVNTLAATLCDQKKLYEGNLTPAQMTALFKPVGDYIKSIKPYMWSEGTRLPKNAAELDKLFKAGQVDFSMNLDANWAADMVREEKYPDDAKAYVLDSGTTSFGQYAVIPFNSANKSGAMTLINEILSGKLQGSMYNPKSWGNLPSVDPMKMEKTASAEITKVVVKRTSLKESELAAARLPQIPSDKANQLILYLKGMGLK